MIKVVLSHAFPLPRFNTHLDTLLLVGNGITDASGVALGHAAGHHPTLASVALGGNAVGDDSARAFADAIRESDSLMSLNLASAKYHYEHYRDKARRRRHGMSALAYLKKIKREREDANSRPNTASIEAHHAAIESVRELDSEIEQRYDGLDGFNPVGWGMPADNPLYNPRMAQITQRGAFQLASALPGSNLTSLDLSGQHLGDHGALALSRAMHCDEKAPCAKTR